MKKSNKNKKFIFHKNKVIFNYTVGKRINKQSSNLFKTKDL